MKFNTISVLAASIIFAAPALAEVGNARGQNVAENSNGQSEGMASRINAGNKGYGNYGGFQGNYQGYPGYSNNYPSPNGYGSGYQYGNPNGGSPNNNNNNKPYGSNEYSHEYGHEYGQNGYQYAQPAQNPYGQNEPWGYAYNPYQPHYGYPPAYGPQNPYQQSNPASATGTHVPTTSEGFHGPYPPSAPPTETSLASHGQFSAAKLDPTTPSKY